MKIKTAKILLVAAMVFALSSSAFASTRIINSFAFNAAKIIGQSEESYLFSPYSIIAAMGMAYAGAAGNTAQEMQRALGFTPGMHAEVGALFLPYAEGSEQFTSANRMWLPDGLDISREYQYKILLAYGSRAITLDIRNHPEDACKAINNWADWITNGRIQTLLPKLDPNTKILITNAVHFNGEWQKKFNPRLTAEENFYDKGHIVRVPMMKQTGRFPYAESGGFKVILLPYEGDKFTMAVVLPPRDDASAEINTSILRQQFRVQKVSLWLPKFHVEKSYELENLMEIMGVKTAFTDEADFSGITKVEKLKINSIIHKTFIDVNENSTEAAGATAIGLVGATMVASGDTVATFHADHPFTYFITENETGTILFMGRQTF